MRKVAIAIVVTLMLTGCAASSGGSSSAGSSFEFATLEDPGNGIVYVYRPAIKRFKHAGQWPAALVNGSSIGTLRYEGSLVSELPPGQHELRVTSASPDANGWQFHDRHTKFLIKAGETRYFRLIITFDPNEDKILSGPIEPLVFLQPVDADEARHEIYQTTRYN